MHLIKYYAIIQEFIFPENVAYPLGGSGLESQQYALMEMHYDNPDMVEGERAQCKEAARTSTLLFAGVVDSSGMRFFYTTEAPQQLASALSLGHHVVPSMLIPPGQKNFTISAVCSADCTSGVSSAMIGYLSFSNFFYLS